MNKKAQKQVIEKRANEILAEKPKSRNDLMLKVKAAGVKNYRIMNKAELTEVLLCLETKNQERIKEIADGAIARWKAGWNTRKKQELPK